MGCVWGGVEEEGCERKTQTGGAYLPLHIGVQGIGVIKQNQVVTGKVSISPGTVPLLKQFTTFEPHFLFDVRVTCSTTWGNLGVRAGILLWEEDLHQTFHAN